MQRPRKIFFTIITAQFLSSVADNALLIAAIALLLERHSSAWMVPGIRGAFYLSYVLLAPFAGAIADAIPKGRVMFVTNALKFSGCVFLVAGVHPLISYAFVGIGAAAYSPAKYGILPELVAPEALIAANAWMEVSTVLSIFLGVGLGSALLMYPQNIWHLTHSGAANATANISIVYLLALVAAAAIPNFNNRKYKALSSIKLLMRRFVITLVSLGRDPGSQMSLTITSLFWAASATLQFIILQWAMSTFALSLAQAGLLQIAVGLGMVLGAITASKMESLKRTSTVLPLGMAIGFLIVIVPLITNIWVGIILMVIIGAMSGLVLIPMNALLQRQGAINKRPGLSIAVQNFYESLSSAVFLVVYGTLSMAYGNANFIIFALGTFIIVFMLLVIARQRHLSR